MTAIALPMLDFACLDRAMPAPRSIQSAFTRQANVEIEPKNRAGVSTLRIFAPRRGGKFPASTFASTFARGRQNRADVSTNSTFVFCNRPAPGGAATAKGL